MTITDRLSRFSKIGGEMVPHVKIEEKLHEAAGILEQTFIVTAVADAQRGERLIVLYREYGDVESLIKSIRPIIDVVPSRQRLGCGPECQAAAEPTKCYVLS